MSTATKIIVWDWNGTLLDDTDACVAAINQYLAIAAKPKIDSDKFRTCFDIPITRLYENLGFTEIEIQESMARWQEIFHENYEMMARICQLREGARSILRSTELVNINNFILSNHIAHSITSHLSRHEAEHQIHMVMAYESRATQFREPKGQRFATHMREQGLIPANGIIIGDTPEEVQIGRELGLTTIAITGGYASESRLQAAKPDYLIHALPEMLPILRQKGFVP